MGCSSSDIVGFMCMLNTSNAKLIVGKDANKVCAGKDLAVSSPIGGDTLSTNIG